MRIKPRKQKWFLERFLKSGGGGRRGRIPGKGAGVSRSYQFAESLLTVGGGDDWNGNEHTEPHTLGNERHCLSQRTRKGTHLA